MTRLRHFVPTSISCKPSRLSTLPDPSQRSSEPYLNQPSHVEPSRSRPRNHPRYRSSACHGRLGP
jgi:hypothetical protein